MPSAAISGRLQGASAVALQRLYQAAAAQRGANATYAYGAYRGARFCAVHPRVCACFGAHVPAGGLGPPRALLQTAEGALHTLVGQRIGPLVSGVTGMALDPTPVDLVAA